MSYFLNVNNLYSLKHTVQKPMKPPLFDVPFSGKHPYLIEIKIYETHSVRSL